MYVLTTLYIAPNCLFMWEEMAYDVGSTLLYMFQKLINEFTFSTSCDNTIIYNVLERQLQY